MRDCSADLIGDRTMLTCLSRAALVLAFAAACIAATEANAQSPQKMTLVQMHPIMGVGEEIFLYAVPKHLGYFSAEGLDVGIQNTQTGMGLSAALAVGQCPSRHHRR